jgi:hypothetical protein
MSASKLRHNILFDLPLRVGLDAKPLLEEANLAERRRKSSVRGSSEHGYRSLDEDDLKLAPVQIVSYDDLMTVTFERSSRLRYEQGRIRFKLKDM